MVVARAGAAVAGLLPPGASEAKLARLLASFRRNSFGVLSECVVLYRPLVCILPSFLYTVPNLYLFRRNSFGVLSECVVSK